MNQPAFNPRARWYYVSVKGQFTCAIVELDGKIIETAPILKRVPGPVSGKPEALDHWLERHNQPTMKQINLGILKRAGTTRDSGKIYDYGCFVCLHTLAVSIASAAILKEGGMAICQECGDILARVTQDKNTPHPPDWGPDHFRRLKQLAEMMLGLGVGERGFIANLDT